MLYNHNHHHENVLYVVCKQYIHRWWEGPNDPSLGKGRKNWKNFPPTDTNNDEGKDMCYAQLMAWGL